MHYDTGPGGIEVLLPLIAQNLYDYRISAFVLRAKTNGINVYDKSGIEVTHGSNRNLTAYIKTFFYVYRNKNDIFHVYNIGPIFLLILCLAGAKRIIYSVHGTIYWKSNFKRKILLFFWRRALKEEIFILANSQHSKSEFLRKIDSQITVRVVYNPIDERRFIPSITNERKNEILIIYSGRLAIGKNLHEWIEIAVTLHKRIPQTRFELYGEGALKDSLLKQINKAGAETFIQIKPFRHDIETVYQKSDLLMFLSEYESFGNVVVESILCGTPVITLPIPSMLEIFNEYPDFLLKENSSLSEQVFFKVKNLCELKRQTTCIRENFVDRFSIEKHINSLEEVYSATE